MYKIMNAKLQFFSSEIETVLKVNSVTLHLLVSVFLTDTQITTIR